MIIFDSIVKPINNIVLLHGLYQVTPSPVALEQLVAAGLAELSDKPDGKLDDIRVGCRMRLCTLYEIFLKHVTLQETIMRSYLFNDDDGNHKTYR